MKYFRPHDKYFRYIHYSNATETTWTYTLCTLVAYQPIDTPLVYPHLPWGAKHV